MPATRSLADWLRLLRDGWPAFVLILALALLGAVAYTLSQPEEYGAEGTLVVSPARGFLDPQNSDSLPTLTKTVDQIAGTPAVRRRTGALYADLARDPETAARRRATASPSWVQAHVDATQEGGSSIIRIVGTAGSQADATDLTKAAVDALSQSVNTGVDPRTGGGLRVRAFEVLSEGKVSPTSARNLALGACGGLILGLLAALALGTLRRRLWNPRELAAVAGLPLLGVIERTDDDVPLAVIEARSRLERLRGPDGALATLVLGTSSDVAASAVATRLAQALHASVLVDADLTGGGPTKTLGLDDARGYSDVLQGNDKALEIVVSSNGDSGPALDVLPLGTPADPTVAAVNARRLDATLRALTLVREHVVVAGPSLEVPSEAMALASATDCSILVLRRGARARPLRRALEAAETSDAEFLGAIVQA